MYQHPEQCNTSLYNGHTSEVEPLDGLLSTGVRVLMAVIAQCCVLEQEEVPFGALESQPSWPGGESEGVSSEG